MSEQSPFKNLANVIGYDKYIYYDKRYSSLIANPTTSSYSYWDSTGNATNPNPHKFVFVPFITSTAQKDGDFYASSTKKFLRGVDGLYGSARNAPCDSGEMLKSKNKVINAWIAWRLGNQYYTGSYSDGNSHQWSKRLGGMPRTVNTLETSIASMRPPADSNEGKFGCYWNINTSHMEYGNLPRLRNELMLMYNIEYGAKSNDYTRSGAKQMLGLNNYKISSFTVYNLNYSSDSNATRFDMRLKSPKSKPVFSNEHTNTAIIDGSSSDNVFDALTKSNILNINIDGTRVSSFASFKTLLLKAFSKTTSNIWNASPDKADLPNLIKTATASSTDGIPEGFTVVKPTQKRYSAFTLPCKKLTTNFRQSSYNYNLKDYEIYANDFNPNYYKYLKSFADVNHPFINFIANFLNATDTFGLKDKSTYLSTSWKNALTNNTFNFKQQNGNGVLVGLPEVDYNQHILFKQHILKTFNDVVHYLIAYNDATEDVDKNAYLAKAKVLLSEMFMNVDILTPYTEAVGTLFIPSLLDMILSKANNETSFDVVGKLNGTWSNKSRVRFIPTVDSEWKGEFTATPTSKGWLSNDCEEFNFDAFVSADAPSKTEVPYKNLTPISTLRGDIFYGKYVNVTGSNNFPYDKSGQKLYSTTIEQLKQAPQQFAQKNTCVKNTVYQTKSVVANVPFTFNVPLDHKRYADKHEFWYRNGMKRTLDSVPPCCCKFAERVNPNTILRATSSVDAPRADNQKYVEFCDFPTTQITIAGSPKCYYSYVELYWDNIWHDLKTSLYEMSVNIDDSGTIKFGTNESYETKNSYVNKLTIQTNRIPPTIRALVSNNTMEITDELNAQTHDYGSNIKDYIFSKYDVFANPNMPIGFAYQKNQESGHVCWSMYPSCWAATGADHRIEYNTRLYLPKDDVVGTGSVENSNFRNMMKSAFYADRAGFLKASNVKSDYDIAYIDELASNNTISGYEKETADLSKITFNINGNLQCPVIFKQLDESKSDKNQYGDKCTWNMNKDAYFISKFVVQAWTDILTKNEVLEYLLGELCDVIGQSKDCLALFYLNRNFKNLVSNTNLSAKSTALYNLPLGPALMYNTDSYILGNTYFHGEYAFANNVVNGKIGSVPKGFDAKQNRNLRVASSLDDFNSNNYLDMIYNDSTQMFAIQTNQSTDNGDVSIVVQIPNSANDFLQIPRMSYGHRSEPFVFITRANDRGGENGLYPSATSFAADTSCLIFSNKTKSEFGSIPGAILKEIGTVNVPRLMIENKDDIYKFTIDNKPMNLLYSDRVRDNVTNIDGVTIEKSTPFSSNINIKYSSNLTKNVEFLKSDINEKISERSSWFD